MSQLRERRKTQRIQVDIVTVVEILGPAEEDLPEALRAVYERVLPAGSEQAGAKDGYMVRELSASGAFLEGVPLPLLSRVRFTFPLPGRGDVEATGWVMWRRTRPCTVKRWDGEVELAAGIGVLFESIPIEARLALVDLAARGGGT